MTGMGFGNGVSEAVHTGLKESGTLIEICVSLHTEIQHPVIKRCSWVFGFGSGAVVWSLVLHLDNTSLWLQNGTVKTESNSVPVLSWKALWGRIKLTVYKII